MNEKKKRGMSKRGLIALLLILAGCAILAGLGIRSHLAKKRAAALAEEVRVETPTPTPVAKTETPTPTPTPTPAITAVPVEKVDQPIDFATLQEKNKDCYAYLEIPDTVVSYPILQSSTQPEDYYLDVTFEGVAGLPGSIYTQKYSGKDFSIPNTVIYGHDMLDGSFFGSLGRYKEREYFDAHKTFYIYTPDKRFTYRVVAESVVNDDNISYLYDTEAIKTPEDFWKYINNEEPENLFEEGFKPKKDDLFVTLSTCIGPRPNNRRIIVGVLEKENPTNPYIIGDGDL